MLSMIILYSGCSPTFSTLAVEDPARLVAMEDSLLADNPEDNDLKIALVEAYLNIARAGKNRAVEYKKVLKLDPRNREARYHLAMEDGHRLYKKGSHKALWDALVAFGKAATAVDTLGEPHYWMAKCYEKKDEMDFELILEAYDKALALNIPDDLKPQIERDRVAVAHCKTTYENFWK